jgi:hypothetical protein
MERLDLSNLPNPYKGISLKTYAFWIGLSTVANHTVANTTSCNFIRAYLALLLWVMLIFNSDRSIIHRIMIYLLYLEFNPRSKIIENIDYSVMVIKWGLTSLSLEQILFNPNMEIFHAIIVTHLIVLATYMPDKIDIEEVFNKVISYLIQ